MKFGITAILLLQSVLILAQPGKYAGTKKSLIGETYTDSRKIPGLSGWQYQRGSMITGVNDPEVMTVVVFKKGSTYIALFSYKKDTSHTKFKIVDVLEVRGVLSSQHIFIGSCQQGESDEGASEITALVKKESTEYSKAIKAWRFNRHKMLIQRMTIEEVKCMNEGG